MCNFLRICLFPVSFYNCMDDTSLLMWDGSRGMLLLLELGLPVPAGLHCTALGVVDDCLLYSTADFFLVWRPVTQSAGLGMCMSWSCRGAAVLCRAISTGNKSSSASSKFVCTPLYCRDTMRSLLNSWSLNTMSFPLQKIGDTSDTHN